MKPLLGIALLGWALALTPSVHAEDTAKPARAAMAKPRSTLAVGATLDQTGALWLARVEQGQILVSRSDDNGARFAPGLPVLARAEAVVADGESRPQLRVARDGTLLLVWTLEVPEKRFAGQIRFARSSDGGKTWTDPITLNDDGRVTSHRFPALTTNGFGQVVVAWLDARDRDVAGGKEGGYAGVSIYVAESSNNGLHFDDNKRLAEHTCECCRTALTWGRGGAVAFWRTLFDVNTRDFALAEVRTRRVSRAVVDDWKVDACPHHGGGVAADADGRLHFVWFTNGAQRQGLFYANRLGDATSAPLPLGRLEAQPGHADVAAAGRRVLVVWREFDGERYSIHALRSDNGGASFLPPQRLADTAGAADYPVPLVDADRMLVVWRTANEDLRVLPVAGAVVAGAARSAVAP